MTFCPNAFCPKHILFHYSLFSWIIVHVTDVTSLSVADNSSSEASELNAHLETVSGIDLSNLSSPGSKMTAILAYIEAVRAQKSECHNSYEECKENLSQVSELLTELCIARDKLREKM